MCVIERKTYVHPNGQNEIIETERPCHRAVGNRLCSHVERRNVDTAKIVEFRPTNIDRRPSEDRDGILITSSPSGNKVYREVGYPRNSKSKKPARVHHATNTTPTDSAPPTSFSSSPVEPIYREVRPGPSRFSPSSQTTSSRPQSALFGETFPESNRTERSDGTAVYSYPPSLRMARADDPEGRQSRPSSYSSASADAGIGRNFEDNMSRTYRPSTKTADISGMSSPSNFSSSPTTSSPGLSSIDQLRRLRSDSVNDLTSGPNPASRSDKGKQPVRSDGSANAAYERLRKLERQNEEDARQAQMEQDRIAATLRRQKAREEQQQARERQDLLDDQRAKEQAAADALARAERNRRALESDREEKERKANRQKRLVDAELKQMARERAETGERESVENAAAVALTTTSAFGAGNSGFSYADPRISPLALNSPTSPGSSRAGNRNNVVIHNPRVAPRRTSSMRQHGDAILRRSQTSAFDVADPEDEEALASSDDDFDAGLNSGRQQRPSRNQRDRRGGRYI